MRRPLHHLSHQVGRGTKADGALATAYESARSDGCDPIEHGIVRAVVDHQNREVSLVLTEKRRQRVVESHARIAGYHHCNDVDRCGGGPVEDGRGRGLVWGQVRFSVALHRSINRSWGPPLRKGLAVHPGRSAAAGGGSAGCRRLATKVTMENAHKSLQKLAIVSTRLVG